MPLPASSITEVVAAAGHLPVGHVGAAVGVAFLSTGCYATSAVLQEREAARGDSGGAELLLRLLRRPRWWLAVAATVAGAAFHVGALALGPLSLVQPLGVLTLVLALPLGAWLGRRTVSGRQWRAAAAVALGLAAVLTAMPRRAPPTHLPPATILLGGAAVVVLVLVLLVVAATLPGRGAPVARAAAAATCFGFASAMAHVAVSAGATFPLAAAVAVLGASAGLGLAQLAYRTGGLGAPLATQNLVDPMIAVLIGATLLGEPLQLTPVRVAVAATGLVATAAGVWTLTGSSPPPPPSPGTESGRPDRPRTMTGMTGAHGAHASPTPR